MRWLAPLALLVLLADCGGGSSPSGGGVVPPGNRPELVCNTTSACLTALPLVTSTPRRGP